MILRDAQLRTLERAVHQRRTRWFARRLRLDHPDSTAGLSDERLLEMVEEGFEDARGLQIHSPEDVYRLIALRFLPPHLLNSPFLQSILIRVLNNTSLSGALRLSFIENQVLSPVIRSQTES